MNQYPDDIYSEPSPVDVNTLRNLGPLRGMAGVWQGSRGLDVKPKVDGARRQAYVERIELQPIDPQTNGPQLLYGLRYHTHITKPDQAKTYHEQVGYWLWEPATDTVIHTVAIPRGVVLMASGTASAEFRGFCLARIRGIRALLPSVQQTADSAFNRSVFEIFFTGEKHERPSLN